MFNKWYSSLFILLLLTDQLTKQIAEKMLSFHDYIIVIPNGLIFQLVHNYGAAYGILKDQKSLLLGISILVLIICIFYRHKIATTKLTRFGLIFLMAGTSGNFIDRLLSGYVIDFIYIYIVPNFNIADVCIDVGIACFLIDLGLNFRKSDDSRTA